MKDLKNANVENKKALVRVDFNVFPIKPHEIRIEREIPTIKYLLSKKAAVILLTHLETNEGKLLSTKVLLKYLKVYFPKIKFNTTEVRPGEISILENLRKDPGEKGCDEKFAKKLASYGDIYVNEAFPASHRNHASIVLLPKLLPAYAGFWFLEEVKNLSKVFKPPHPATLILGGGKIDTKLPILEKLLPKFDNALIGGALLNLFIFQKKELFSKKLILPSQVVTEGKKVMDVGLESFEEWNGIIKKSKFIVWNGPLGFLERGYSSSTKELLSVLFKTKAQIIIGGGDTLACLAPGKKIPKNIFVSTGGGAMLDYLLNKTLPGIKALR